MLNTTTPAIPTAVRKPIIRHRPRPGTAAKGDDALVAVVAVVAVGAVVASRELRVFTRKLRGMRLIGFRLCGESNYSTFSMEKTKEENLHSMVLTE
jgi:hypothetical protein